MYKEKFLNNIKVKFCFKDRFYRKFTPCPPFYLEMIYGNNSVTVVIKIFGF